MGGGEGAKTKPSFLNKLPGPKLGLGVNSDDVLIRNCIRKGLATIL